MTAQVILDKGGSNQITLYYTSCEENGTKAIKVINIPTSTAKGSSDGSVTPKSSLIVDLLKFERRFTFDGYIDYSDKQKLRNLIYVQGTFKIEWDAEEFNVCCDKYSITEKAADKLTPENFEVKLTLVQGNAYGKSN